MNVSEFDGEAEEWDRFVRHQPDWTHFHLHGWKAVIESVFGHACCYLAARIGDELCGVLPLVWVRSRLIGSYLVSMPFVNYGGPLGDPSAVTALLNEAIRRARTRANTLLELRSRHALETNLPVSHRKVTVILDLPSDPDALWKKLTVKVRSQVRRPRKEGIRVEFGYSHVASFHRVFSRHMRDLGTPTHSPALFESLLDRFHEDVWVACAYCDNTPVAAGFGFVWNGEFEMTWASALREYSRFAPNMLLYWSCMERAVEEGLHRFNFGRCTPGGGTHRFKRQWGGRDEALWWYHTAGGRSATPSPDDARYAWGPRVWRKLPLAVANQVGPRIVRWLP